MSGTISATGSSMRRDGSGSNEFDDRGGFSEGIGDSPRAIRLLPGFTAADSLVVASSNPAPANPIYPFKSLRGATSVAQLAG